MLTAGFRLLRLALCLAAGLAVASGYALLARSQQRALVRAWARALLGALGVQLRSTGSPPANAALVVANHVSWLDVIAMAAIEPAVFVCKSEVARWPALGWLLRRVGTIFIERARLRDIWRVNNELRLHLAANRIVAAFPEGTTTMGHEVLPFRTGLFEPAVERALPVHPACLAYSSDAAAYVGDTSFASSLMAVATARGLAVDVDWLPAIEGPGIARREAARIARQRIGAALLARHAVMTRSFESESPSPLKRSTCDGLCGSGSRRALA
jgi:1-acyl-sn-glycerol-3-phosphate acyltransferase